MCGINGIFDFASKRPIDPVLIAGMNARIEHRGPDDHGMWRDDQAAIGLGHQRLSILDLSANGHQPMSGERGAVIVYNGEIYNFRELRRTMSASRFRSDTDTEVLVRMFEQRGFECLERLNGMFAFAVWDPATQSLSLARDRLGIKPLYYNVTNGVFAFSSEIKALLTLPWIDAELDEPALYHFLTFNKLTPPSTMFRGIHKFHPGHRMVVDRTGINRYESFWDVEYRDLGASDVDELVTMVDAALQKAVDYRLLSDVPVGAFLSGGVDSSGIVALMAERSDMPVRTYSIGFRDAPGYDERDQARQIAAQFGTDHHEKVVTRQELVDFLPHIVEIFDEPLADATSIPIWFLSRIASEDGTKVILTGDGADEAFCGYRNWAAYHRLNPLFRTLTAMPAALRSMTSLVARRLDEHSRISEILTRAANGQEFFWGGAGGLKESAKATLLSRDFLQRTAQVNSYDYVAALKNEFLRLVPTARHGSIIDWMVFVGLRDIVPNFYLYRADRLGMAHSIELRVPFLDHEFINLAVSISAKFKVRHGESKYLLKKSLKSRLDRRTLYRPKQGFCVPLAEWTRDTIADFLNERIDAFCAAHELLNRQAVRALLNRARRGDTNVVHTLWNIFFLIAWVERWL